MKVQFTVPGEPVAKGRPRFGNGRTYTPQGTRDYAAWVQVHAREAMRCQARLEGPIRLFLLVVLPMPKSWSQKRRQANEEAPEYHLTRPDFDNLAKAVADACNGIVWNDDGQVAVSLVIKVYGAQPRMEVEAEPLGFRLAFKTTERSIFATGFAAGLFQ